MKIGKLKIKIIVSVLAITLVIGLLINGVKHSKAANSNILGTETLKENIDDIKNMSLAELEHIFGNEKYAEEFNGMLKTDIGINVQRGEEYISEEDMYNIYNNIDKQLPSDIKEIIDEKGISIGSLIDELIRIYCDPNRDEILHPIINEIAVEYDVPEWLVRTVIDIIFYIISHYIVCPANK